MIRHHNKFIQYNKRKMFRNFAPTFVRNFTQTVKYHYPVYYFAQIMLVIFRNDYHKIFTVPSVIPILQSCGFNTVFFFK